MRSSFEKNINTEFSKEEALCVNDEMYNRYVINGIIANATDLYINQFTLADSKTKLIVTNEKIEKLNVSILIGTHEKLEKLTVIIVLIGKRNRHIIIFIP